MKLALKFSEEQESQNGSSWPRSMRAFPKGVLILILLSLAIWFAIPFKTHTPAVSKKLTPVVLENSKSDFVSSEQSQIVPLAIRDVHVGMRVPAHNPEVDAKERTNWSDVDYSSWRKYTVSVAKENGGGDVTVVLLRPASWLVKSAKQSIARKERPKNSSQSNQESKLSLEDVNNGGGTNSLVWLELPELGVVGFGEVLKNEASPLIQSGSGEVVTATFVHQSAEILDLTFQRTSETSNQNQFAALESDNTIDTDLKIGTTSVHPFWSVDREEFIAAGELKLDEKVVTIEGQVWHLTSIVPRAGPEPVYNFEVANEHVYYVGKQGVLVHNSYPEKKYVEFVHGTSLTSAKSIKAKGLNVKEAKRLSKGGRANNNGLDTSIVTPKTWKMRGEEASGWAARHAGKGEQGLLIGD